MRRFRFAFPLTGGIHQAPHLLPIAIALHRRGHDVAPVTLDAATSAFADNLLAKEAGVPPARLLGPGAIERMLGAFLPKASPRKSLRLLENRRTFADADALIIGERTSWVLRRAHAFGGLLIHIPHGAGDRAVGYESRIASCDYHVVAGIKDRDRFVAAGLAEPNRIAVSGYVKLGLTPPSSPAPFFADANPVVLYNPHFDPTLGSFGAIGIGLMDRVAARGDFNLIVAPHVRLAQQLPPSVRKMIEARAAPNILIDLGSVRSCDMSYTRAADVYLGDVSSQIYEFQSRPRPAVFVNAAGIDWTGDEHFSMWRMGRVVEPDVPAVLEAIDRALAEHPGYLAEQRRAVDHSLGGDWAGAADRAADAILRFMNHGAGS